jgi:hypothetical protein
MTSIAPDHPVQTLLFFVDGDYNPSQVERFHQLVEDLGSVRSWILNPPVFVDEGEENPPTLGVYLDLYAADRPDALPLAMERLILDEVKAVLSLVKEFSKEQSLPFGAALEGELIGSVENGEPDEFLQVGLIGEWERILAEREGAEERG